MKCKKDTKSLKNNIFAIIRLVLQITEYMYLQRNIQTSIVLFLRNTLMQQYWNIYATLVKVGIKSFFLTESDLCICFI